MKSGKNWIIITSFIRMPNLCGKKMKKDGNTNGTSIELLRKNNECKEQ